MSFYVYTASDGLNYRHDEHPPSVTVLDASMTAISPRFETSDDSDSAASVAANRYAIGHWEGKDLSLFDLRSGEPLATFPFERIGPMVTFDRSGERLLFKSGSRVILLSLSTGDWVELKGIRAIDRKKCLHSINTSDWSIEWSTSLRKQLGSDHMGVGQFCGDGTLFGAAVAGKSRSYTIVFDAETGEAVNSIGAICYGLPHVGTLVRNQSSQKGTFTFKTLDLSSGIEGTLTLSPKRE